MSTSTLDQLLDMVEYDTQYSINTVLDEIHNKFRATQNYVHTYPTDLEPGDVVRYVDSNLAKLSRPGIIVKMDRNPQSGYINNMTLSYWNKKTQSKAYWRIKPYRVYMFRISRGGKFRSLLEDLLNNDILTYEVEKLNNKRNQS